jgi:ubiquinone biosynthesis protein COQ9
MAGTRVFTPRLASLSLHSSIRRTYPQLKRHTSSPHTRNYYSYEHESTPPFTDAESAILSAALAHVPTYGFSSSALTRGAHDAGYLDVSTNLFPRGAFDLINYYIVTQRLALGTRIQFPEASMSVGVKVRALALHRLHANKPIIHQWQEVREIRHSYNTIMPQPSAVAFLPSKYSMESSLTAGTGAYHSRPCYLSTAVLIHVRLHCR